MADVWKLTSIYDPKSGAFRHSEIEKRPLTKQEWAQRQAEEAERIKSVVGTTDKAPGQPN